MKKLFTIVLLFSFTSCVEAPKEAENVNVKYIYDAAYSSDWKMGDPNLSNIVLSLQKAAQENDYDKARELFHPEIEVWNGDGSIIKGLDALDKGFRGFIENYKIDLTPQVWISIYSEELDENWVLLWSYEEYKAPDDSIRKLFAQESFRIKDDKIIRVNQFQRDLVE